MKRNAFFGLLTILLVFSFIGCENEDDLPIPPEKLPENERWAKWVDPTSTATIDYSIASDGVATITVSGIAETNGPGPYEWNRWKATMQYKHTTNKNTSYTYVFEAWSQSGTRPLNVLYYSDFDYNILYFLDHNLVITDTRTIYTYTGEIIPKDGVRTLDFQCADQLGTFYIKILSITENIEGDNNVDGDTNVNEENNSPSYAGAWSYSSPEGELIFYLDDDGNFTFYQGKNDIFKGNFELKENFIIFIYSSVFTNDYEWTNDPSVISEYAKQLFGFLPIFGIIEESTSGSKIVIKDENYFEFIKY